MSKLLLFLSGGFFFSAILLQTIDYFASPLPHSDPWFLLMLPSFLLVVISKVCDSH